MAALTRPSALLVILYLTTIVQDSTGINIEALKKRAEIHEGFDLVEYAICLIRKRPNCAKLLGGMGRSNMNPDARKFARGLPPAQNNEQDVNCFEPDCEDGQAGIAPAKVCFIIQKSCTAPKEEIKAAVELSSMVANSVGGNARVTFVTYSGAAEVLVPLTNPTENSFGRKLKNKLKSISDNNNCDDCRANTAEAIEACREQFGEDERPEAVEAIMIFFDGVSYDTRYNMAEARQRTLDIAQLNVLEEVTTVVMKYTNPTDTDVTGNEEWEAVNNYGQLVVPFSPHEVILEATQQQVYAEEKFCGVLPFCETQEDEGCAFTDIVLVMDASNSIKKNDMGTTFQFLHDLINDFHISDQTVRVGIISYNKKVFVHADLNDNLNKTTLLEIVNNIPRKTLLYTNTMDAIEKATKMLLQSRRNGVARQVIFLATDGVTFVSKIKKSRKTNKLPRKVGHRSDLTIAAANIAKDSDIEFYITGLPHKLTKKQAKRGGSQAAMDEEWRSLASDPFDCHFINMSKSDSYTSTFEDLKFVRLHMIQQLCFNVPTDDQCKIPEFNLTLSPSTEEPGSGSTITTELPGVDITTTS